MLLTITTTHQPATDLGFLLHKHPARVQACEFSFGKAHVFYPEATDERCTAALLLDVDPVGLVRGRGGEGGAAGPVRERPPVRRVVVPLERAIAQVFGTALAGDASGRPELAATALPLEARLAALPCRGGEGFLRALFEPLGYAVDADPSPARRAHSGAGARAGTSR